MNKIGYDYNFICFGLGCVYMYVYFWNNFNSKGGTVYEFYSLIELIKSSKFLK